MTDNKPTAERLQQALSQLIGKSGSDSTAGALTVTELCQRAGVSRTTLYRYHSDVLRALHEWKQKQCRKGAAGQRIVRELREESATLRTQVTQLTALVDHYFAAWSESQVLLKRREDELAALRRRSSVKFELHT